MSYTHTHKRAERRARNIAGAEALAVARRPEVASREKNPAAAGIRRFFPFSKKSKEKISALVLMSYEHGNDSLFYMETSIPGISRSA